MFCYLLNSCITDVNAVLNFLRYYDRCHSLMGEERLVIAFNME